jgi:anthranilate/para-aminobenzoate synthase component I
VVGDLAAGSDALELLRAAFPGGSITGACIADRSATGA